MQLGGEERSSVEICVIYSVTIQQPLFLGLLDSFSLAFGGLKGGEVLLSPFFIQKNRIFLNDLNS